MSDRSIVIANLVEALAEVDPTLTERQRYERALDWVADMRPADFDLILHAN